MMDRLPCTMRQVPMYHVFCFSQHFAYKYLGHVKDDLHQDPARLLAVVSFLLELSAVVPPPD